MSVPDNDALTGPVLEEAVELTLAELCRCCGVHAEYVVRLVDEAVVEPLPGSGPASRWRFSGRSLRRVHTAIHLERDLGVNPAGAALALDLLDRLARLEQRLARERGG